MLHDLQVEHLSWLVYVVRDSSSSPFVIPLGYRR